MAKSKQAGLRRDEPLFLRLSVSEKALVRKRARATGLTMDEYARCKIFEIPFEYVNGRVTTQSHKVPAEATKATA